MRQTSRRPAASRRNLGTIADAADYLGCHPRTIRRWIAAGRLTGFRVGPRQVRIDLDELNALVQPIPTTSTYAAVYGAAPVGGGSHGTP